MFLALHLMLVDAHRDDRIVMFDECRGGLWLVCVEGFHEHDFLVPSPHSIELINFNIRK